VSNVSPFPMTIVEHRTGRTRSVIDEICKCGALRTEHSTRVAFGHGNCTRTLCLQFTWRAFVFDEGGEEE